jgi:hypothetical protein
MHNYCLTVLLKVGKILFILQTHICKPNKDNCIGISGAEMCMYIGPGHILFFDSCLYHCTNASQLPAGSRMLLGSILLDAQLLHQHCCTEVQLCGVWWQSCLQHFGKDAVLVLPLLAIAQRACE